ncbi:Peptide synthetase XpsB [Xenorhabdus nematophila ATCC 19061]|uniref:Peptide synthetase XpsB n=1 Tax=Xenorhabdus nematophila (strain ATCC 19061 / DSM 3370 / CCUG 14189 / LMG 1036 / NCIMB 9965 / AN6) TaxID=406817 RepID=D3VIX9_XENNA|nr:non-ribosomal peptide synthetase [Xenorhabdus nematophila]CBJ90836.1 Peptide synthetase XpsB [Xenorhabdus nematophila ATCC 19061]CEK23673.1 Peptide synthetase PaxB [Xenorhabdus nematophila AN6/1]
MNNNELSSLSLAERRRLLELAKSAKLSRQPVQKTEITPQSRENGVPLSWSQQRLWFLAQLDPAAQTAYHMSAGLNLQGQLNLDALQAALDRIVARHEIMRTTITIVEDGAQQTIDGADCRFSLIQENLSQLFSEQHGASAAWQAAVEKAAYLEATRPFDFINGPLARGRLLKLAEDQHILLLTQHHIISDGWSVNLLMQELSALYHAFSQGLPDPLPALPIQYADYVIWQKNRSQGTEPEKQVDFWRNTLQGAPALLELPTDRPRPTKQSYAGGRVELTFPPALYAGLKALSQRHSTTLFMTLLAGWSTLLSRISGQDDIVIGTPVANRQQPELAPLIGFFANTLALRVQLHANPTVSELLAQIREQSINAFSHQDLPFEQLVEILSPSRSLSHSPIFQVMLSLENLPGQRHFELPGLKLEERPLIRESAYFDLTLTLNETGNGLAGELEYARDLFDHTTIERMVSHLYTLLAAMAADDAQRVTELPLITSQQREQLLVDFNKTTLAYPQDKLIHQLFEQQAESNPDAIALVYQDTRLSYAELNQRANQLAHSLIAFGIRPDDRIALCVDRSLDMIIGMLGILKAGAGYIPLEPEYPAERLAYQLSDSKPKLLLTQQHLQTHLAVTDMPVWLLDDKNHQDTQSQQPTHNPDAGQLGLLPHHLAYIIYTSGSTGLPKGVMLEHRNVISFIHAQYLISQPQPEDRILQFATMAFDTSVSDIFPTLAAGATLILRPAHIRVPDTAFIDFLNQHQITIIDVPTAFWHQWVQEMKAGRTGFSLYLNTVIVGGEKAEYRHLVDWQSLPDTQFCRWINSYGPTETTVTATNLILNGGESCHTTGMIPIGHPNANSKVYILDPSGQPVPIGVSGEIHIGGDGVARGYLNRPELTAERFVRDPFSKLAETRMYKTGDLGRWLPDGNIEYLGRNDFQVKIRGFRIELGEIEAQLAACDGVKDAVVIAREEAGGDKRLVAYLIPQPDTTLSPAHLREQLSHYLMEHMIPGAFVMLEAFPLTGSGKLDRKALPEPDRTAIASREYEAPQGDIEQKIAEVWQSLLRLEQVGRHDNFFELGGHSLLTVQMASRLRQSLNIQLDLQDLFTHPILADLAQSLHSANQTAQQSAQQLTILPASRQQTLPLSWAQQRLWFLAQLDSAAQTAYHISGGLRLKGNLSQSALQATLDRIIARHEILRTTIKMVDGVAQQIIADADCGFNLRFSDLSQLAETEKHAAINEAARFESYHPFDFETDPLIRGQLLKLANDEHVVLLTQHHMISDGWSLNVLMYELTTLYRAFHQGQPDPLPELMVQYADYALWQRQWLQGEVLEKQVNFWRDALQGAPALLELPTDKVRPAVQSYRGAHVTLTLSPELSEGLKALSQHHSSTLFMTLLTAWSILLSRISGQQDIVIGTPVANRQHSELEPLIGFFANTLALRVKLADNPTVSALLAQVKAHALAAYVHQDLPFEQLVETLKPPRSLSHSPVFQVMLALDNTPIQQSLELSDLTLDELPSTRQSTHFDLSLSMNDTDKGLVGELEYASDLFDHTSIERLASYLQTLLAAMVEDDSQRVDYLPLLQPQQRNQLLVEFNDTALSYSQDQLIHQLFEQQVAQTPDATALVFGDSQLSYAELNHHANQLAHYLIASGVRPDDRIAICVDRSPEMIIGMYGILKAGAGYIPLDPEYPSERLAYQLSDSKPALLLTQQHLQAHLPVQDIPVLLLDDANHRNTVAQQPNHNPDAQQMGLQPYHLAYIIYTSGSTGQPKGVMLEHRNVVNFIHVQHKTSEPQLGDRILQFATVAFDTSVSDIFPTLASGATLVLRPAHIRIPDTAFVAFLREQKITIIDMPTAFWHHWVQEMMAGRSGFSPDLHTIIVGGEKAEYRHLMNWLASPETQSCRWINSYGPTETTVIATTLKLDNKDAVAFENSIPIGYPLPNSCIYILDTHGQPVPIGTSGEIHIGGAGVARGYLNRPDLTTEKFISDPFSKHPDARMYKTGDLGRWLPNGTIEYLGRNDFQVKIRGFRIELGEIETQLAACDGVSDAVVIAREEGTGDKRLVAYLIPQSGVTLSPFQLREQLSASLMEHMLPSAFVMLEAFPLSANGKLDRNALPAPDHSAIVSREYEAPQGKSEQQLATVWQSLLGLEQVGRHDNFFELGGHSLLVVNLIEELRQLNLSLEVSAVFSAPTLAAMSARLNQSSGQGVTALTVPPNLISENSQTITPDMLPLVELTQDQIDRVVNLTPEGATNIQDIYPLGPLQAGILFHHLLETEGDTYLDSQLMAFDSRTHLDNFLRVFQQVIDRHDILRSAVHWQELPEPVQVVYRRAPLPMTELTLSTEESAETQLRRLTDTRTVRMDITKAPLLKAHIAHDPESGQWLLSLLHHHLVCDHVSLDMIFNEMKALFLGEENSLPTPLPYRNFIAQTRSVPPEVHQDYFRKLLGDVDEPTLPFGLLDVQNSHHDADPSDKIVEDVITLDHVLARNLRECAHQQGMSAAVLFHAAWAQVLARCSGRDDVVFGTVLLGRLQGGIGASQVLGMFINTLPVRVRLQARSVQQVVQETYKQLSELLDHEQAPLAVAQRCSGIQAPLPLFNSLLNFRHSPRDETESTSQVWEGIEILSGEERSNYPLSLDVDDFDDGFALTAQCSQQINPARLNAYMEIALKEIVSALQHAPGQSIEAIEILPLAERNQLLVDFNDTELVYPQDRLIHQLIEQQAARIPDTTALVFGDTELSYSELNRHANQLAHSLIAFGVRPDDHVALCVERSPEMIIAMLGILKAGANYVPLDPEYPVDRLAYQLSDSKPVLLLTQQHLQAHLPQQNMSVWLLDDDSHRDSMAQQPAHNPDAKQLGIQPHHLAYIIYTSGSTGQPKGVMIEHRNVVGFIHAQHQISQPQIGDRILQFATVAFDTSVSDIFPTLAAGSTLVLRPAHIRVPDTAFVDYLNQQKITVIDLPTAFWHHWVQEMKAGRVGFSPHLRALIVGGEKAEYHHLVDWQSLPQTQHCRWINTYGPTETTVIATHLMVDSGSCPLDGIIPIGHPNANTQIYILDTLGHPVPCGVSGEIHIAGTGVGRGYLNRPDLTEEKFVANPFSKHPDARMYKTGDLGRWLSDGTIEYLGRNDFQVKIRGFRIELGEIEVQLLACSGVREALVVAREEANGDKRLVAYVISQPDVTLDINRLREQLNTHLAAYMVPNAFVVLAAFPLTASGKVDRKALPAPDRTAIASHEYEAPEGEIEQQIAVILQTLLQLEQVGRHDSFFDLGGNSLSIIQLMARLRDEFHLEISIPDIFAHPTLSELAELIASRQIETFFAQEDIESLQKELENLSEDELRALLNGDN